MLFDVLINICIAKHIWQLNAGHTLTHAANVCLCKQVVVYSRTAKPMTSSVHKNTHKHTREELVQSRHCMVEIAIVSHDGTDDEHMTFLLKVKQFVVIPCNE